MNDGAAKEKGTNMIVELQEAPQPSAREEQQAQAVNAEPQSASNERHSLAACEASPEKVSDEKGATEACVAKGVAGAGRFGSTSQESIPLFAACASGEAAAQASAAGALRKKAWQLLAQTSTFGRPESFLADIKSRRTAALTSDVDASRNEAWQLLTQSKHRWSS